MSPEQARGQGRRQARGHLGLRRGAVRDALRAQGVRGRDRLGHARRGAARGHRLGGAAARDAVFRPPRPAPLPRPRSEDALSRHRRRAHRDGRGRRSRLAASARRRRRGADAAAARWLAVLLASPAARGRRLVDGAAPPAGCGGGRCPLRRDAAGRRISFPSTTCRSSTCRGMEGCWCSSRTTRGGRSCRSARATASSRAAVAGTEGASSPFFSPDGQWIGFFAEGKLKKVPTEGGVAITLADAPNNRGGVWLADDGIVYAPDYTSGLMRISSRGGKPETLTSLDAARGERTHRWPTYAPGRRRRALHDRHAQRPGQLRRCAHRRLGARDAQDAGRLRGRQHGALRAPEPSRLRALRNPARSAHRRGPPRGHRGPDRLERPGQRRPFERNRVRGGRRGRNVRVRAGQRAGGGAVDRPDGSDGQGAARPGPSARVQLPPLFARRKASRGFDRSRSRPLRRRLDGGRRNGRPGAPDLRRRQERQLLPGLVRRRPENRVQHGSRAPGNLPEERGRHGRGGAAPVRCESGPSGGRVAGWLEASHHQGLSHDRDPHGLLVRSKGDALRAGRRVSGVLAGRSLDRVHAGDPRKPCADPRQAGIRPGRKGADHLRHGRLSGLDEGRPVFP